MRITIVGGGKVGFALAKDLMSEKHQITVIVIIDAAMGFCEIHPIVETIYQCCGRIDVVIIVEKQVRVAAHPFTADFVQVFSEYLRLFYGQAHHFVRRVNSVIFFDIKNHNIFNLLQF
jgi:glycerol-3-phosphate dehydrogenase